MMRLLVLVAEVVVLMWFAPWWTLAPLGVVLGLFPAEGRGRALTYGAVTFGTLLALTWLAESYSGFLAGHFLSSQLGLSRPSLYALSALILSTLVPLGFWTGHLLVSLRRT